MSILLLANHKLKGSLESPVNLLNNFQVRWTSRTHGGQCWTRQDPSDEGRGRAALGELWRVNSCFWGQIGLGRRKRGGTGYISFVYFSLNHSLNPDGVNETVEGGRSVFPLKNEGGGELPSALLLCKGIRIILSVTAFVGHKSN